MYKRQVFEYAQIKGSLDGMDTRVITEDVYKRQQRITGNRRFCRKVPLLWTMKTELPRES